MRTHTFHHLPKDKEILKSTKRTFLCTIKNFSQIAQRPAFVKYSISLRKLLSVASIWSFNFKDLNFIYLTSHILSIWFKNFLQAACPSSESKSIWSSDLQISFYDSNWQLSSRRKLALHQNSSSSVNGLAGAVDAQKG